MGSVKLPTRYIVVIEICESTYLLTYAIQHSHSLEANQFQDSQESPHNLWNLNVHTTFTNARHLSLS
jgi:hypothetical protein